MRRHRTARFPATLTVVALVAGLAGACQTGPTSQDVPAPPTSEPASGVTPAPSSAGTRGPAAPGSPSAAGATPTQAELDERLRRAAWDDDRAAFARLVRRGANVDAKDETRQSAYLVAASEGHLDLLRLALRHGASIDDKDSWNGTALIRAAERGHALVVGELLRAGIDRDHVNRIGYQAVHEAVWLGRDTSAYATTVRVLAAGGARLTDRSRREGLTPLEMAGRRGFDRLERTLRTVTTAQQPADADRALLRAAREGDADAVAVALRAGADIEARDARRRTALLLAVTGDHVEAARVLVAMGADPDALDDRHDTPWLVTGVTGSVAMLEVLLPARPDLTIVNRFGGVSVIPASERGHVDYVRRVVRTGIDVDHVNDLGWTALLEAVILGDGGPAHQEIVRILLDAGADPAVPDADGVTALQHAERRGHRAIVRILRR
ncbi:MAG TPA: ankyrin repeat domain-containing protein [Nocardioides sp.]|uniref:ankyrin repeat domain-containing protein n=1 Tax=Nocardioides sp. TaxID=35761 RepID=UPI002EDA9468